MKKIIFVALTLFLMCSIVTGSIYADDEDTLDLNTEDAKNKKENYSSLTDINGLNIFTNDMNSLLEQKEEIASSEISMVKSTIFTEKFQKKTNQETSKNSLFKEKVVFDKIAINESTNISIIPFVVIGTFLAGAATFILTLKYYNGREKVNSENNDYIYK